MAATDHEVDATEIELQRLLAKQSAKLARRPPPAARRPPPTCTVHASSASRPALRPRVQEGRKGPEPKWPWFLCAILCKQKLEETFAQALQEHENVLTPPLRTPLPWIRGFRRLALLPPGLLMSFPFCRIAE